VGFYVKEKSLKKVGGYLVTPDRLRNEGSKGGGLLGAEAWGGEISKLTRRFSLWLKNQNSSLKRKNTQGRKKVSWKAEKKKFVKNLPGKGRGRRDAMKAQGGGYRKKYGRSGDLEKAVLNNGALGGGGEVSREQTE